MLLLVGVGVPQVAGKRRRVCVLVHECWQRAQWGADLCAHGGRVDGEPATPYKRPDGPLSVCSQGAATCPIHWPRLLLWTRWVDCFSATSLNRLLLFSLCNSQSILLCVLFRRSQLFLKGEVRTIDDGNICERRRCMKNNGKSPTFKFVFEEERHPSEVQRVPRGWRLPGATHSSADLTWIRKWLKI